MKKALYIFIALSAMWCGVAFGAGSSFLVSSDVIVENAGFPGGGTPLRVITLAFTADDSDASIPSLTLSDAGWTDGTNSDTLDKGSILGCWLFYAEIDCNHAGTEPTEDSDIDIYQNSIDLFGGNGEDKIDNSTENVVLFDIATQSATRPIYTALTVTITNNAVTSATGVIRLFLIP